MRKVRIQTYVSEHVLEELRLLSEEEDRSISYVTSDIVENELKRRKEKLWYQGRDYEY